MSQAEKDWLSSIVQRKWLEFICDHPRSANEEMPIEYIVDFVKFLQKEVPEFERHIATKE